MSTQKILMLILLSISIAFIYKPDLLSYFTPSKLSFTNLFNSKCSAMEEFQFDLNHEKKEHEELHHSTPVLTMHSWTLLYILAPAPIFSLDCYTCNNEASSVSGL